jgi:subtilase family serine protease
MIAVPDAVPDPNGVVEETQENNKKSRRLQVTRPDFTVSALKAAGTAAAGSSIVVQDTTSNKAPVPAGASTTRFYLSTDALLDAGDTLLVNSRAVSALEAKKSDSGSTPVTIPPGTVPGVYFVLAVADGDGVVSEVNEANNVRSRKITITP